MAQTWGSYKIVAALLAGRHGRSVSRGWDTRIDHKIAIEILPALFLPISHANSVSTAKLRSSAHQPFGTPRTKIAVAHRSKNHRGGFTVAR